MAGDIRKITIDVNVASDAGKRIDRWLVDQLGDYSRSQIQKMIHSNLVKINGNLSTVRSKIAFGDRIEVEQQSLSGVIHPQSAEFLGVKICYVDRDILVIGKPPGLVVHPTPQTLAEPSVTQLVLNHVLKGENLPGLAQLRPGIVHRLDQQTSGLMVCALSDTAYQNLTLQFQQKVASRSYLALVCGKPKWTRTLLRHYLTRNPSDRRGFKAVSLNEMPGVSGEDLVEFEGIRHRMALGEYSVLTRYGDSYSLIKAKLYTGRTHQIRVQLAGEGLAILGDPVYGTRQTPPQTFGVEFSKRCKVLSRQLLHAEQLKFYHPRSGRRMEFDLPAWDDMAKLLDLIRPHGSSFG